MPALLSPLPRRTALQARDTVPQAGPSTSTLAFTFFVLLFATTALTLLLLYLRRRRLAQQQGLLPTYAETNQMSPYGPNDDVFAYSSQQPSSAVPEIRVTFPDDDQTQNGSQKMDRVVVVHVTDTGSVGMAPLSEHEEQLPPYQRTGADGFQSLDLNRMGGLREKELPLHAKE